MDVPSVATNLIGGMIFIVILVFLFGLADILKGGGSGR